jgi:hypothetical protein
MNVASLFMPELDPRMGLVGALVRREADVPVDAEQGAADWTWIRPEVGADLPQGLFKIGDEALQRLTDLVFVAILVGQKPLPAVVPLQFSEELKELPSE